MRSTAASSSPRSTTRPATSPATSGLRLEVINGGELPGGEEIYRIDGDFYTYAEASADWLVASKAFKDELQAAPWPQNFDSFTARGRELDNLSVPEWFDPAHPRSNPILAGFGPSSRFARLLLTNVISEYGGNAEAQPALNLLYLLAWNPRQSLSPLPGTDELYHVQGGNEQIGRNGWPRGWHPAASTRVEP